MSLPDPVHPATAAAQALGFTDPATGAFVPPIQPATTYERDPENRLISGRLFRGPTTRTTTSRRP